MRKIRKGTLLIIIGVLLISTSAYPLSFIIRESVLESYVNNRYEIEPIIDIRNNFEVRKLVKSSRVLASPFEWEGNMIEVLTKDTGVDTPESIFKFYPAHIMTITIKINGKEASLPTEAWLPPRIVNDSDYLSMLNIVKVSDKEKGRQQLIIVQNLVEGWKDGDMKSQKWRLIYVNKDKTYSEEVFSYPERVEHLLGVKLVQISSQASTFIGYTDDYFLPNIFYPLVYPLGSSFIGIVLLIIGALRFIFAKRLKNKR
ncbi:hypothetical protein [Paenibacillus sp. Soil787]|uniref:hypothetical protein n=1 Tax=Paenibacillus sp. Soil787 TaxID=1736411 RepID=UPI000702E689|nr:hypothetical protein [Paenibacillus sp. Soil787]KRF28663.1 hypothetical protein ASG93_28705 [Paenibacillus sp. Soil787]